MVMNRWLGGSLGWSIRRVHTFYPTYNKYIMDRGQHVILNSKRIGRVDAKKAVLKIRRPAIKAKTEILPPLGNDFMNFKVMSGNEILLNLENVEYFRISELINSFIELGKRKDQELHDWEVHPYTKAALEKLKQKIPQLNAKHTSQVWRALNRLNINNPEIWKALSHQIIRIIHKFDPKSIANILDVFVPPLEESLKDDVVYLDKEIAKKQKEERCNNAFLQRIVTIMPIHVKKLTISQLVRVCEVWSQRNLGDKRLYKEFLFFYIEKNIKGLNIDQYVRILRVLGDRRYTDDLIFWNDFVFPKIYLKALNQKEAKKIWDALIALKVKCPELNWSIPIEYIESLLKKFELIEGFEGFSDEIKNDMKNYGDLPRGVKTKITSHFKMDQSQKAMEIAQRQVVMEHKKQAETERQTDPEYIKKKALREERKKRRDQRESRDSSSKEEVLYDSD